jgi:phosphopantetheinyl transferase
MMDHIQLYNKEPLVLIGDIDKVSFKLTHNLPSQYSKKDLENYKLESRRMQFCLIRNMVQEFYPEATIRYQGKMPVLERAFISISHSHELCAVIIHEEENTGIDIQQIDEKINRIAGRFLSDEELEWCSNTRQRTMAWSMKESLYKIYGIGSYVFREQLLLEPFDLSKDECRGTIVHENGKREDFLIKYNFLDNYSLAYIQNKIK